MIIYPAVDLRQGRCVRLQQGDAAQETVFADDPVEAACRWVEEGATWLHVVNLDGAFGEPSAANWRALERILAAVGVPIQFGGGVRTMEDVSRLLEAGVRRVILGTAAVQNPELVREAVARYGAEQIAVGLDARQGRVAVRGWAEVAPLGVEEVAQQMAALGVERIIYTDIQRDGMLQGVNIEAVRRLARVSNVKVVASGGVASLEDIRVLKEHEEEGIEGVIIGMALYRGAVRLREAIEIAKKGT